MAVYLIGFMGAGKSTIGRLWAKESRRTFYDLDDLVSQSEGRTVKELFIKRGEAYFREIERYVLHQTFKFSNAIVALGGGTPCFFDNMKLVNQYGQSVYLKLSPDYLFSRLKASHNQRPLLDNKDDQQLRLFIEQTLQKREQFYNQAQNILDTNNHSVYQTVEELKNTYK